MQDEEISNIADSRALATVIKAEIDTQISTAKAYPRSVKQFIDEASELATMDIDIAAECFYVLPARGENKKPIEGPSSRLAEIVQSCWGNCRSGARIIGEEQDFIIAQGVFHDLERNSYTSYEVRRRITNKEGRRYSGDMIATTGNAACSIALRNAVFKGVPKAFWRLIYQRARSAAVGDLKTITERREKVMQYWENLGITREQIFRTLDVAGLEDVGQDELLKLRGIANAINEGDTTPEQAFADTDSETNPAQSKETEALNKELKEKATKKAGKKPTGKKGKAKTEPDQGVDNPPPTLQPDTTTMTKVDVFAKVKLIENKLAKAKTPKDYQEITDLLDEVLDLGREVLTEPADKEKLALAVDGVKAALPENE